MPDLIFVKSTYSTAERECVEVATNLGHVVAIRDSKDPDGPILRYTPEAWQAFRAAVARDELTR